MSKEILESAPTEAVEEVDKTQTGESLEETPKKAPKKTKKEESVAQTETIMVPKGNRNEDNFIIIMINGKRWRIQRGIPVTVPKSVAEVYKNSLKQQEAADRFLDAVENGL